MNVPDDTATANPAGSPRLSNERAPFEEKAHSLESQLAEEREKNERLRGLLAEAVEWARRPSPIPIRPFNDFIDRAVLASTGSEDA